MDIAMSFSIEPTIEIHNSVSSFTDKENISRIDLIFTQRFLYDNFFKDVEAQFVFYDDFCPGEPNDAAVDRMLDVVRRKSFARLIAIGGGSILDCAKLLALDSPDDVEALYRPDNQPGRAVELILVPTTCGTGCEVTCVSVLDFPRLGSKIGKRFNAGFADRAVLIPELLSRIPYQIFAVSSADALVHAMEIFLSPHGNEYTDLLCLEAIRRILEGYKRISQSGRDVVFQDIRSYLVASNLAGLALANTLPGAVHAVAMHFGSMHHVPHGEATRLFLPSVMKGYLSKQPSGKIVALATLVAETLDTSGDPAAAFERLEELLNIVVPVKSLSEYGMAVEDALSYADKVMETQQRLLINNFVDLTREEIAGLYRGMFFPT